MVCDVLELPGRKRADPKRSIVWLPLRANAKELGALVGVGRGEGHVDPTVLDAAAVLAAHVATSLDAAFALQRARVSATTDALTGILNRRGLEERIERGLASAQEQRRPLSLLVLDCDDFKQINDRAGHQFGDTLLREIADVLVQSVPRHADAARLGGDEFVVMLPGAGVDTAEKLGTEIRRLLAEGLTDAGFPLRISGGVATYPFDGATTTALLRAADQALYAAKIAGKNRIASFRDLTWLDPGQQSPVLDAGGRRGHGSGAVLADAIAATRALEAEETVEGVCTRLCKALVFLVGATACSASRVQGEYLVDATGHALREIWLGDETAYRIADFPVTGEVLRTGQGTGRVVRGRRCRSRRGVHPPSARDERPVDGSAARPRSSMGTDRAVRDAASALQRRRRGHGGVPRRPRAATARGRGGDGRSRAAAQDLRAAFGLVLRGEGRRRAHDVGTASGVAGKR